MPEDRFAHLELTRLVPAPPRRRGGGGGVPIHKHENVHQHGEVLGRQLQGAEDEIIQKKPQQFDPGLLMKLRIQPGTLSEDALRSFGIDVISEESNETLVVFINDGAKQEFLDRLARYQRGETGVGVSANVFHAIEDINQWQREDRIGRTLSDKQWLAGDTLTVDIELWPRESLQSNRRECDQTVNWLIENGSEVWDSLATGSVVIIRAELNGSTMDNLLELETVRVVELPPSLHLETVDYDIELRDLVIEGPEDDDATPIAILDSGVVTGHPLIGPAMGEATSFLPDYDPVDETGHGSAVAGFSLYGDLEKRIRERRFSTSLRLLSGKVLSGKQDEYDRKLIATQIIEAVNYFNGDLGCRVFNISFGDSQQPYDDRHVKGLAVVLDELSRELDILFVISAGNFNGTDNVPNNWRDDYPEYLFDNEARIIDPATSLNSITVGSIARYDVDRNAERYPHDPSYQPIARVDELSPFTRTGPGPNNAIKPDVVEYGGNLSVDIRADNSPRFTPPDPNISEIALKHTFAGDRLFAPFIGTSFAAPKITYLVGQLLRQYPDASNNLLRILILLNASWPESALTHLQDCGAPHKELAYYSYGYGRPDSDKTIYSLENCVTVVAEEVIGVDQTHFYEIPFPDDFLTTGKIERLIKVGLSYCPPCRSTRRSYKGSKISFKVVAEENIDRLSERFRQGSELENIAEWSGFEPGSQMRSRGTAMVATKKIKVLPSTSQLLNGKSLFIVVTHQVEDWAKELVREEEPYALTITLEDRARDDVRLYTQLRARLRQRIRARA